MSLSINSNSSTQMQALADQLAKAVDTNKDGQISTDEFGAFILNLLQGNNGRSLTSSLSTASTGPREPGTHYGVRASADDASRVAGLRAEEAVAMLSTDPPLGFMPEFMGFEHNRLESARGSMKYDAFHVLKSFDPHDPSSIHRAFTVLDAMHPGMYELDELDNLMLSGTADGYIGARPMNRDLDWNDRSHQWCWQWMHYNEAHPGPNGEVT
jgi:hypothetical protein